MENHIAMCMADLSSHFLQCIVVKRKWHAKPIPANWLVRQLEQRRQVVLESWQSQRSEREPRQL